MFLGTYQVKVMPGRRVAVPATLRKDLGDNFILARWYEGCLVLVGRDSLNALLTRITGKQEVAVKPIRDTERFIFGSSFETTPDDQGRIIIPERLATYANIGEEIFFIGVGDKIEIWNKELWEEKEKSVAKEAPELIDQLDKKRNG